MSHFGHLASLVWAKLILVIGGDSVLVDEISELSGWITDANQDNEIKINKFVKNSNWLIADAVLQHEIRNMDTIFRVQKWKFFWTKLL